MWWLIAKPSPLLTSCWRVTKTDTMAWSKDLIFINETSLWFSAEHLCYFPAFFKKKKKIKKRQASGKVLSIEDKLVSTSLSRGMYGVVTLWLPGFCGFVVFLYGKRFIFTICHSLSWDWESGVNSALRPLRWCNSHHSTCHSSWQALHIKNSI